MSEIHMPRLSDTMEEGVISSWQKQIGEKVSPGDVLVEIETDKAVMEYEAFDEGYLIQQTVSDGDTVAIGAVIGHLGDTPDTAPPEPTAQSPETGSEEKAEATEETREASSAEKIEETAAPATGQTRDSADGQARGRTSPLARRLAREYGLDINQIQGSGPKGRVVRADIESVASGADAAGASSAASAQPAAAQQPAAQPAGAFDDGRDSEEVQPNNIRKVVARRMAEAKQQVPHFYLRRTIDAEPLREFRSQINAQLEETGVKVSFNDLIIKATATVLRRHPAVNSSWVDGRLLRHNRVNIGMAVAIEGGLVVPVVHDADRTNVSDIAVQTRELAAKARDNKLKPQEMSGGTFSVSNLGMFGVDSFSAVINPPEAAILAVGAMRPEAVVADGEVTVRNTISLELSVDHRAVDGAMGAQYLKELAEVLEQPMRIVV